MVQDDASPDGRTSSKPHAVVIPIPYQGHVVPAAHLALRLAARGVAVTFVNTELVHHQMAKAQGVAPHNYDMFAAAGGGGGARCGGDLRYEVVSDGYPVAFDRIRHARQFLEGVEHTLAAHVEELFRRVVLHPASAFLVADTNFAWPAMLARRLAVPYVSFWSQPALVFQLYYHMDLLAEHGHIRCEEPRTDTITYIPGVPAIEPGELTSFLQEKKTEESMPSKLLSKAFEAVRGADYVLCNTVEELEPSTLAAMRADRPVYTVGPIFASGFSDNNSGAVATSMLAESSGCAAWLDAQPAGSVLYISFGSNAHVTRQELREIAGGVLASGARFLWVMRSDIVQDDEDDALPEGFAAATAETGGRGLVVPWCRQTEMLGHRAVGGFLTHCGCNSVFESLWAGVPMLCFPLLTDQFTTRKLVVRDWGVGVSVGDRGAVFADEVRARIEGLMSGGKEGEELRRAVKEVRATMKAAAAPGGSTQRSFDEFVDEMTRRCAA